jgi:hypothetical protein
MPGIEGVQGVPGQKPGSSAHGGRARQNADAAYTRVDRIQTSTEHQRLVARALRSEVQREEQHDDPEPVRPLAFQK